VKAWISVVLLLGAIPFAPSPSLPDWSRGVLEFHQLSTGEGNSALVVFPDGTTMLIDAGGGGQGSTAGARIARYLERRHVARLDYVVLTHFHADHAGALNDLGARIPIGTVIDRGQDYLRPPDSDPTFTKYRAFLDATRARGAIYEPIRVGRADQIVLRRDRSAFANVEVRAVAASGQAWTGHGDETTGIFPPLESLSAEDQPSDNRCSIGLRLRDGRFSLFTGGDMPGIPDAGAPAWQSVETAVARAIGRTDVHVVNHHGSIDPESEGFLATLRSPVMILPSWSSTHPSQDALKRMMATRLYPGPHDIFATLIREAAKESIGARASQVKADHGHIVVRVEPGGGSFRVFVIDERSDSGAVLGVFAY